MSDFLNEVYFGNPLHDWLIALLVVVASPVLAKAGYWLFANVLEKLTSRTLTELDDILVSALEKPLMRLLLVLAVWLGVSFLKLPPRVDAVIGSMVDLSITLLTAWFLARLLDGVIERYLKPLAAISTNDLDDQLLPIIQKVGVVLIWGMALIMSLKHLGYDVGALLAGLGIGGVAVAMASKDTIANMFGGFTILADRPFQLHDRIKVVGYDGVVKEIGLRSTRLQTLEGRTVTIPNSKFSESPVENVSWEPACKIGVELMLAQESSPQKVEQALAILRDIVDHHASLEPKSSACLSQMSPSGFNISLVYYIRKEAEVVATRNEINLAILRCFAEADIRLAKT